MKLTDNEKQLILNHRKAIQENKKSMSEIVNDVLPDVKNIYNTIISTKNVDDECKENLNHSIRMLLYAIQGNIVRYEWELFEEKKKVQKLNQLKKQVSKALCINLDSESKYYLILLWHISKL